MSELTSFQLIAIVLATIGLVCTLLTLWLLKKLKWNGFILILTCFSACQLIFDISFLFILHTQNQWGYSMYLYLDLFGEIATTSWTNILSLNMFRIVYSLKSVNIYKEFPLYTIFDIGVPTVLVIYSASSRQFSIDNMQPVFRAYYWIRLFSVVFNVIFYAITAYMVSKFDAKVKAGFLTSNQATAIKVLVSRMKYYSVVQVLLRTAPCWWDYDRRTMGNVTAHYAYDCTAPASGIGYFLVFLTMQPGAKKFLLELFYRFLPFLRPKDLDDEATRDTMTLTRNEVQELDEDELNTQIDDDSQRRAHISTHRSLNFRASLAASQAPRQTNTDDQHQVSIEIT